VAMSRSCVDYSPATLTGPQEIELRPPLHTAALRRLERR
jgi:hypothetical protein